MQVNPKTFQSEAEGTYSFGHFELHPSDRRCYRKGEAVLLPPKAFDALVLLLRKAGQLVQKAELVEALWPETYVSEANLTNAIVTLRKALGREAIQTVSKYGYRLNLPVTGEPGIGRRSYETFVRAKQLTNERSLVSMSQARDLYWLCIAENPGFAAAWAWLGRCFRFLDKFGRGPSVNFELAQAAFRRALSIDPDLACAHHFYTQLQADCGEARDAVARLVNRLNRHRDEPESFAGLVQVLRFCGLLDESLASHARAKSLDPAVMTSVTHSHFLRGEYQAVIETYGGQRYYLDAAAWAALGDKERAIALLRERLASASLSSLMSTLMESLLALLEGRPAHAAQMMRDLDVVREPEVLFYFARQSSMMGNADEAILFLRRAQQQGFTSSRTVERDPAFAAVRKHCGFERAISEARHSEENARRALEQAGGSALFRGPMA